MLSAVRTWAMAWIAGLALGTAGCVLAPVDLTGRPCPCAQGWSCVEGVCRPEGSAGEDAGTPRDAGADAARDGGPVDAAQLDASAADAEVADAEAPDAEAPDAGPADAGAPDGGPGPTRCDDLHAGAIFCDGFEWVYPAGRTGWDWDLLEDGNVDTVVDPTPYLGERALRATTTVAGGRAAIGATLPDAIVDGEMWLRAFFYIPAAQAISAGLSLLYIGAEDGSAGIAFQAYGGGRASVWIGTQDRWEGTETPLPRDVWTCLQLHVVVDDAAGEVELYLDDVLITVPFTGDTLPLGAGGFRDVEAGIEFSNASQGPTTLYVDEVVLSRTRVPCE